MRNYNKTYQKIKTEIIKISWTTERINQRLMTSTVQCYALIKLLLPKETVVKHF